LIESARDSECEIEKKSKSQFVRGRLGDFCVAMPTRRQLTCVKSLMKPLVRAAVSFGAFVGASLQAHAGLSFVQITDPHLFGKEAGNERALRQCVDEINRRSGKGSEFRFVVVTGDLGIEDLVSDKIDKLTNPTAAEKSASPANGELANPEESKLTERRPHESAKKDCEKGAQSLGEIIRACAVKKWLFLVGNNDLLEEDPNQMMYYTDFVGNLSKQLTPAGFQIIDLTPPGNDPGIQTEGIYTFVGFNDASFKANNKFADAERWAKIHDDRILALSQRIQGIENAYIFFHIPEIDDPFYVFDATEEQRKEWQDNRKDYAKTGYKFSAWTVPDATHHRWDDVLKEKNVKGLFAGHFHDWRRDTYSNFRWLQKPQYNLEGLSKLHICPPLAEKRQIITPSQARGFQVVTLDNEGKPTVEIVWYNEATFSIAAMSHSRHCAFGVSHRCQELFAGKCRGISFIWPLAIVAASLCVVVTVCTLLSVSAIVLLVARKPPIDRAAASDSKSTDAS
jgi:hypothetical protein